MDTVSPDPVYSTLESLIQRAIRRFGDMSASTADGETLLMFLDFANEVIDDMRMSPYWISGTSLDYYTHIGEVRSIPDHLMSSGLLAKFSEQQRSKNAPRNEQRYYQTLNTHMFFAMHGDGSKQWEFSRGIE